MSTLEIAKQYVELCKAHQYDTILDTLFAPDAVSVEAGAPPGVSPEVRGLDAIKQKGKDWGANNEVHGAVVEGPWPNGNRFIVRLTYDLTNKPSGQRMKMDETALFTIENGKITREEFFYSMG